MVSTNAWHSTSHRVFGPRQRRQWKTSSPLRSSERGKQELSTIRVMKTLCLRECLTRARARRHSHKRGMHSRIHLPLLSLALSQPYIHIKPCKHSICEALSNKNQISLSIPSLNIICIYTHLLTHIYF